MRCVPSFLLTLRAASRPAPAQRQPEPFSVAGIGSQSTLRPETVVERLMSFDRHQHGRITSLGVRLVVAAALGLLALDGAPVPIRAQAPARYEGDGNALPSAYFSQTSDIPHDMAALLAQID